jgi:hypothetical protein
VKAIVLDDAGTKMRPPKDPEKFRAANKKFDEELDEVFNWQHAYAALLKQCANSRTGSLRGQLPVSVLPGRSLKAPRRISLAETELLF